MDRHSAAIHFHTPWSLFRRKGPLVFRLADALIGLFICAMTLSRYCHVVVQSGTKVIDVHGGGTDIRRFIAYFTSITPALTVVVETPIDPDGVYGRALLVQEHDGGVSFWKNLVCRLLDLMGLLGPRIPFNCVSVVSYLLGRPDLATYTPKALLRLLRLEPDDRMLYDSGETDFRGDLQRLVRELDRVNVPDFRDFERIRGCAPSVNTTRFNRCVSFLPGTRPVSPDRARSDRVAQSPPHRPRMATNGRA